MPVVCFGPSATALACGPLSRWASDLTSAKPSSATLASALYDFTAIGDVVNVAPRLQGQAAGGEIMLSERVASGLPSPVGTRLQLSLKGKSELQTAYRVSL